MIDRLSNIFDRKMPVPKHLVPPTKKSKHRFCSAVNPRFHRIAVIGRIGYLQFNYFFLAFLKKLIHFLKSFKVL